MVKTSIATLIGCAALAVTLSLGSYSGPNRTLAADAPAPAAEVQGSLTKADFHFVKVFAGANAHEIAEGKLAVNQGGTQEVKDFGQRMVDDHTKIGDELAGLLKSKGVTVSMEETKAQAGATAGLAKAEGDQFDKTYAREALKDHQGAVKLFQNEAEHGDDPDLKAFAEKTLPTLQMHLDMAMKMEKVGSGK